VILVAAPLRRFGASPSRTSPGRLNSPQRAAGLLFVCSWLVLLLRDARRGLTLTWWLGLPDGSASFWSHRHHANIALAA
jgi:hypothetical protein